GFAPAVEVTYEPSAFVMMPSAPLSWADTTLTDPDKLRARPVAIMKSRFMPHSRARLCVRLIQKEKRSTPPTPRRSPLSMKRRTDGPGFAFPCGKSSSSLSRRGLLGRGASGNVFAEIEHTRLCLQRLGDALDQRPGLVTIAALGEHVLLLPG